MFTDEIFEGVCVEALCSPRISDSLDVIINCLSSVEVLLRSDYAKQCISINPVNILSFFRLIT